MKGVKKMGLDIYSIDYICFECGFEGKVMNKERKIICPTCGTMNDVWFEGEEPPVNHKQ